MVVPGSGTTAAAAIGLVVLSPLSAWWALSRESQASLESGHPIVDGLVVAVGDAASVPAAGLEADAVCASALTSPAASVSDVVVEDARRAAAPAAEAPQAEAPPASAPAAESVAGPPEPPAAPTQGAVEAEEQPASSPEPIAEPVLEPIRSGAADLDAAAPSEVLPGSAGADEPLARAVVAAEAGWRFVLERLPEGLPAPGLVDGRLALLVASLFVILDVVVMLVCSCLIRACCRRMRRAVVTNQDLDSAGAATSTPAALAAATVVGRNVEPSKETEAGDHSMGAALAPAPVVDVAGEGRHEGAEPTLSSAASEQSMAQEASIASTASSMKSGKDFSRRSEQIQLVLGGQPQAVVQKLGFRDLQRRLVADEDWGPERLPRWPNGLSKVLKRPFYERLLSGEVEFQAVVAADVTGAQGDLKHLDLEHLLVLRCRMLDFRPASGQEAHVNFLQTLERLLFEGLVRRCQQKGGDDEPSKQALHRLGLHLVLFCGSGCGGVLGDAVQTPDSPSWWLFPLLDQEWAGYSAVLVSTGAELWLRGLDQQGLQELGKQEGDLALCVDRWEKCPRDRRLRYQRLDPSKDDVLEEVQAAWPRITGFRLQPEGARRTVAAAAAEPAAAERGGEEARAGEEEPAKLEKAPRHKKKAHAEPNDERVQKLIDFLQQARDPELVVSTLRKSKGLASPAEVELAIQRFQALPNLLRA